MRLASRVHRTTILAVTSLWLIFTARASAFIENLTVLEDPETPGAYVVHSAGYFFDGCWGLAGHSVVREGNKITVTVNGVDGWQPGLACITVIMPYSFDDALGELSPGIYCVDLIESLESLRYNIPDSRRLWFSVGAWEQMCSCPCFGDFGCDNVATALDVVALVNGAFRSMPVAQDTNCPMPRLDLDCSGALDVIDVIRMVDIAFRNGDAAAVRCSPCSIAHL